MLIRNVFKTTLSSIVIASAVTATTQAANAQVQFQIAAQGPASLASIQTALATLALNPALRAALGKMYADIGYQPLFVNGSSLTPLATELRSSLEKIQDHGLSLGDYWSQAHEALFTQASNLQNPVAAELLLAETYVAVSLNINVGRISGGQASSVNKMVPRTFSSFNLLEAGARGSGIGSTWDALAPKADGYQRLKSKLIQMLDMLAQRRAVSDKQIVEVQLNMEKYRWLPNDPGPRYLLVNTAMQTLRLTDPTNTNPKLAEMRTINGKPDHATPSWVDHVASLELNPPWHVTTNIFAREKYPEIRSVASSGNLQAIQQWFDQRNFMLISAANGQPVDPTTVDWMNYVPKSGLVILTERPGYTSSLGVVKFNLQSPPGPYYLHDTDTRAAFANSLRLLSHGCVRVQNPIDLAEYLLVGSGWDRARIQSTVLQAGQIAEGKVSVPLAIPKENRIPVYILNLTADVGLDGTLRFAKDSYRDTAGVESALRANGFLRKFNGDASVSARP